MRQIIAIGNLTIPWLGKPCLTGNCIECNLVAWVYSRATMRARTPKFSRHYFLHISPYYLTSTSKKASKHTKNGAQKATAHSAL